MTSLATINLLRLVSPALPIGAFAYSQGLEAAIEAGHISSRQDTEGWLEAIFQRTICQLDLPIIKRIFGAYEAEALNAFLPQKVTSVVLQVVGHPHQSWS